MKTIDIVTLFPEILDYYFENTPINKKINKDELEIITHQLRDFTEEKHKKVDDNQYGGEAGMVLMAEPLINSINFITKLRKQKPFTILLSPQGEKINHLILSEIFKYNHLAFVCGRYEGVDERFIEEKVDIELSVGDFILSGGELPAMLTIEALLRFVPGNLGNRDSFLNDSFGENFISQLKGPVYTRPSILNGRKVPDILLSGDHKKIQEWRKMISEQRTQSRRNDLLK
jgi:tRNA (guanine37-N1)-methyltransferase